MLEFPEPVYTGTQYSADDVEALRQRYKERHQDSVQSVQKMSGDYGELSSSLTGGMSDAQWDAQLKRLADGPTTGDKVRLWLSKVGLASRPRPVSEVLEEQLESVQEKIHGVARLRESIDGHIGDLEADIRRLNQQVVEAAHNEEAAAKHVLQLSKSLDDKEMELLHWDIEDHQSAAYRVAVAAIDELKSQIRIHGSKARAFGHAENRLESVVRMNRNFLEMLKHTAENMEQLAGASNQVVEEISGNVRALTSLTLATDMALDLMAASKELKAGINKVAEVASNTSLTLTREIDQFVADMTVYDASTVDLVEQNLSEERRLRQTQIDEAIEHAYETTTS